MKNGPQPVTLVIFGGAGDLTHRKLLPALYNLHVDRLLPPRFAVLGVGLQERFHRSLLAFLPGFAIAILLHSAFNHLFLSPKLSTLRLPTTMLPTAR